MKKIVFILAILGWTFWGISAERITDQAGAKSSPLFSHDGASIAYLRENEGTIELWVRTSANDNRCLGPARSFGWMKDGRLIYSCESGLFAVSAKGEAPSGKPQGFLAKDGANRVRLADQADLFLAGEPLYLARDYRIRQKEKNKAEKQLTRQEQDITDIVVAGDGTIYYTADGQLWKVSGQSDAQEELLLKVEGLEDFIRLKIRPGQDEILLLSSCARYAADGHNLLKTVRMDGTEKKELWPADYASWSPDGKRIVYAAEGKLWLQDMATGARRCLSPESAGLCAYPSWSPDGKKIVFVSVAIDTNQDKAIDWRDHDDLWMAEVE